MASLDMAPSADGLRAVIRKLGTAHAPPLQHSSVFANLCAPARHASEEVRVRALCSILFKLDNSLASPPHLWEADEEIFALLLEWFNFPTPPRAPDVLALLLRLVLH
ncbi:hypothetical protein T484DRAFT_1822256, partial [Baffinella frigidus]